MKNEWLSKMRAEQNYTQREFANAINMSYSMYSKIESKERRPSVENAKKIAKALGFIWTKFYEEDLGTTQLN